MTSWRVSPDVVHRRLPLLRKTGIEHWDSALQLWVQMGVASALGATFCAQAFGIRREPFRHPWSRSAMPQVWLFEWLLATQRVRRSMLHGR
jgi:hypothetical protein